MLSLETVKSYIYTSVHMHAQTHTHTCVHTCQYTVVDNTMCRI